MLCRIATVVSLGALMIVLGVQGGWAATPASTLPASPSVTTYTLPLWGCYSNTDHPKPASGGAFYHDGKITLIGGLNCRDIVEVDVATWTPTLITQDNCGWNGQPCWLPMSSAGYAWTGSVAFIGGGAMWGDEGDISDKIRRWDSATRVMTETGYSLPAPWFDGVAVWHEDMREIWMLAGFDVTAQTSEYPPHVTSGAYTSYIRAYSPERGLVRIVGNLPHAADNTCAAYDPARKSVWIVGGHAGGVFYDDIVEVQANGATRTVAILPTKVDFPGCMIYGGRLYVAGGRNQADMALDTVFAVDAAGNLSQVATLPAAQIVRAWASDGTGRLWLMTGGNTVQLVQVE